MKRKKRTNVTSSHFKSRVSKTKNSFSFNTKFQFFKDINKPLLLGISALFLLTIIFLIYLFIITRDLPPLTRLERIDPAIATQVYSADGKIMHSFFTFNRTYTPYEKIPSSVIQALISMEDRTFYDHWGVNIAGIVRAMIINTIKMSIVQGGSTLTQQLAKNLYFGQEQTITRKIKEAFTAIQIEKTYSKNEILEMYLNINDFGNNSFGIQAASRRYFNKPVNDLKVEEAALLIGVLKGTTIYSPIRHPERAKRQRNIVLSTMVATEYLSKEEYDSLKTLPLNLNLNDPNKMSTAPYFLEYVRLQLNALQDSLNVNIYEDGLRVYTTLNTEFQHFMEKAVTKHIDKVQERVRKQSAFNDLRKELSDSAFNEVTTAQIAFIAINPHNGNILAMIGGRDLAPPRCWL